MTSKALPRLVKQNLTHPTQNVCNIQAFRAINLRNPMRLNLLRCTLQRLQISCSISQRSIALGCLLVCLLMSSGCAFLNQLNPSWSPLPLELSISRVTPTSRGGYLLAGRATLPNQTRLTLMAIRTFRPIDGGQQQPIYVILDRQTVELNESAWEGNLQLWQPTTAGQLQETWQRDPDYQAMQPDPLVSFSAVLEPLNQDSQWQKRIEVPSASQQSALRYTDEGKPYLQAVTQRSIAPPPALPAMALPVPSPVRSLQATSTEQVPSALHQQTDMPLASDALFR